MASTMTMTMTMEAWLAQLEMDQIPIASFIDKYNNSSYQPYEQSLTMEGCCFDEELAATLGEDFPYSLYATSDDTASYSPPPPLSPPPPPLGDFDCNLIEQYISTPLISDCSDNNNMNNINDGDNVVVKKKKGASKKGASKMEASIKKHVVLKEATSGYTKRKRPPSQVQDHILAERKRRELLSHLFISLSAIVPGLKKIDKTSVLGEAIKHMKQLQEKVKVLEQVAAKRTMESVIVVKKSKVIMVDDNGSSDNYGNVDDYCTSATSGRSGNGGGGGVSAGGGGGGDDNVSSFPEIEVKICGNTMLLRVYCEQQKGILTKLFAEVDNHDLRITNSSVIPFENFALVITIVAQMEIGFNNKVKDFVRALRNALRLTSYQRHESSEDEH
ncbi:transcription factor bHLH18-like [Spinacia oleracea]|uniref:Transcription factor bHLH18-like n=1 Tax=Spinacia oleracea TaxID=3562 RepID=A0A9R0JNH9_SPIOL|nr:transcription factor bHLH18-like [Spinacia oleracea]